MRTKKKSNGQKRMMSSPSKKRKSTVVKPFADGTLSNSAFFGMIRAALRSKSRFWYPIKVCRERARIPYVGSNKRRKWLYKCENCSKIVEMENTVVHHTIECGSLSSFEDLPVFTQRLFCDSHLLRLLCTECHDKIHEHEKT